MLIRKLFKFEGAHIVRNCYTERCKLSLHGHSYKVEVLLYAGRLDAGQMVCDFSVVKAVLGEIIEAFDHAIVFWKEDIGELVEIYKKFSARWIQLPVSPSAEQLSRVLFALLDDMLTRITFANGEDPDLCLQSIIVHETDTGYAQAFRSDLESRSMGRIELSEVVFSDACEEHILKALRCTKLVKPSHQIEVK